MKKIISTCIALFYFTTSQATVIVPMKSVNGNDIGNITFSNSQYGLLITPKLEKLSSGSHGFHMHLNANCSNNAKAAGGHFDPNKSGQHLGPYTNQGHLGDLPALTVDNKGNASTIILAPRLNEKDILGHAFVIHAGGDNYSDHPKKLGGGGARVACGFAELKETAQASH